MIPETPAVVPGITCRTSAFAGAQGLGVAKVIAQQAHFVEDAAPGCPADTAACQSKAYVTKGDTVLTGVVNGPYLCVMMPNKQGGSAGWVKPDEIATVAVNHAPPITAWAGAWKSGATVINLTVQGGQLVAAASAPLPNSATADFYPPAATATPAADGAAAPDDAKPAAPPPVPTVGKMAGVAQPVGDAVEFADPDPSGCRLDLRLVGPFLMAGDNGQCAGGAIRFAGIFRKPSAAAGSPRLEPHEATTRPTPTPTSSTDPTLAAGTAALASPYGGPYTPDIPFHHKRRPHV